MSTSSSSRNRKARTAPWKRRPNRPSRLKTQRHGGPLAIAASVFIVYAADPREPCGARPSAAHHPQWRPSPLTTSSHGATTMVAVFNPLPAGSTLTLLSMPFIFTQDELLTSRDFLKKAKERGYDLSLDRLQQLHRHSLLVPFYRVTDTAVEGRRIDVEVVGNYNIRLWAFQAAAEGRQRDPAAEGILPRLGRTGGPTACQRTGGTASRSLPGRSSALATHSASTTSSQTAGEEPASALANRTQPAPRPDSGRPSPDLPPRCPRPRRPSAGSHPGPPLALPH